MVPSIIGVGASVAAGALAVPVTIPSAKRLHKSFTGKFITKQAFSITTFPPKTGPYES